MSDLARFTAWIDDSLPERLPPFLLERRWFGSKARPIAGADVEDVAWLPGTGRPCAVLVVGVRFADGGRDRYAMLLAFASDHGPLPVVGQVEAGGRAAWVVEAAVDADAALALLRGFAAGGAPSMAMRRGGALQFRDADQETASALSAALGRAGVRAVGAEQSNTTLRIDDALAFKLFRRLEDGENPELEMGRFLATRTPFRAMPMLRGSLTYAPASGPPATIGVLQDWVRSRGDGWTHVVARLRDPGGEGGLVGDLRALGGTTADFHAALAADPTLPAFAPEPATPADIDGWRTALADRAARAFQLIERSLSSWPEAAQRDARAVLAARSRLAALAPVADLRTDGGRFVKIRIHGDFHLGQTLKTDDGFVLIDFEGEPARPLEERRLKQCALKDVAGMLRSFDYAAETAASGRTDAPTAPAAGPLRQAFLDGYSAALPPGRTAFLPDDRSALDGWIASFEAEKALYEVEYEINNRPAWVGIPLRGLRRILGA